MTQEQFIYWLQGFVEAHNSIPTTEQWEVVKDHLKTVFRKVTPQYTPSPELPVPFPKFPAEPYPYNGGNVIC